MLMIDRWGFLSGELQAGWWPVSPTNHSSVQARPRRFESRKSSGEAWLMRTSIMFKQRTVEPHLTLPAWTRIVC